VSRVLLSLPVAAILTAAAGVSSLVAGLVRPHGSAPQRIERLWGRALLRLWGVEVRVSGSASVPAGPAVYAANHAGILDIPVLFGHLPAPRFRIIHKRSLYALPLIGAYLYLSGHVGIDRAHPFRARRSLSRAAARLAGGESVLVFPEGTRSPNEAVLPFKKGSFVLALQAGVPIVPVSLSGVKRLSGGGLLRLRTGAVSVTVHAPIATVGRGLGEARALADETRAVVSAGCARA
jgi:1-acyl-sn-glycerol-3-phosphate acyltransferase